MDAAFREVDTQDQEEVVEMKITVTETKIVGGELLGGLDTAQGRLCPKTRAERPPEREAERKRNGKGDPEAWSGAPEERGHSQQCSTPLAGTPATEGTDRQLKQ